jgi:hypothetical protein
VRHAGTLLLAIARLLFDESVLSRAVYPTIADLQEEVREAGTDRRRRLLARWRGYTAFWILVLASPIAFRSWPMTPHADRRALLNVSALIVAALVVVAVLVTSGAMVEFEAALESLPEELFAPLGAAHVLAFMAGPVALGFLVAISWLRGPARLTVRPAEATLVVLLSATVVVTTSTAVFVTAFTSIARTGGGGVGIVYEAWVTSHEALTYAAVVIVACLLVVAALTQRSARVARTAPAGTPRMTARLAVALAAMVGLALVAVDLLLRTYYGTLDLMVWMFDPGGLGAARMGSIAETASFVAHNTGLVFAGGAVLTVFLVAAGAITWRVSRTRTPHAILTWASRAALAIVMVGALWHAREARATLDTYRELPQVNVPRPPVDNRM